QRERETHHSMRVAVDGIDERASAAVDREAARDAERLTGGDVRVDLLVGEVREGELAARGRAEGRAGAAVLRIAVIHEPVPGMQHAGAAAHCAPPLDGAARFMRLADDLPVD